MQFYYDDYQDVFVCGECVQEHEFDELDDLESFDTEAETPDFITLCYICGGQIK